MGQHKTIEKICEACGLKFTARLADHNKGWALFCSRRCKNSEEFNPNYKGGQLTAYEYKLRAKEKNPLRFAAMQAVQSAVRNGSLVKQPCEVCASPVVEAHHDDYTKPLQVRWLCREHHVKEHHK